MAHGAPSPGPPVPKATGLSRHRRTDETEGPEAHMPHMHRLQSSKRQSPSSKSKGGAIYHPLGGHPQRPKRQNTHPIGAWIQVLRGLCLHLHRRQTCLFLSHKNFFIYAYRRLVMELGAHPRILRTDHGTEYLNKEMTALPTTYVTSSLPSTNTTATASQNTQCIDPNYR